MAGKIRFCEICRQLIHPERLAAEPRTVLCAEHAKRIDKHGGEFIRTLAQERTSKGGSLKQSYGSASIDKTRNQEALEKLRAEYAMEQEPPKE